MACKACEERRQAIVTAYKAGGIVNAVKVLPAVARHVIRPRGPVIARKDSK
jgi:hypothetical protein